MKVVHIAQRDDPATGGAVRVAVELVKRLPHYGIETKLLFLYGYRGIFGQIIPDSCDYLELKNSRNLLGMSRLWKYLSQETPHLVHHHDDLLWPQLLTLIHPPYQKIIHSHIGMTTKPQSLKVSLLHSCQRFSANAVVCITEAGRYHQEIKVGFVPKILHVINNGVDFDQYALATPEQKQRARIQFILPPDQPVVGFVGRLHNEMKGVDDFLQVIASLPSRYWGLVAGTGPDWERLQEQAQKLGISERLRFTGLLSSPHQAYQAMDVFCFTSRYEPFGLTLLEAMACQIPVVGFRCPGGSSEIFNSHTGIVIENRDIVQMAKAVAAVCEGGQESLWKARLEYANRLIKNCYSWEISTSKLVHLYQSLLKGD